MGNLKNLEVIVPFDSTLQASQESEGLKFMPLWIPESSTHKTWKFMQGSNLKDRTNSVIHQLTL
jgi:hypothetical protein